MTTTSANPPPAPRFGSIHLLLWIAATGVYLATNRDLYAQPLSPLGMLLMICQVLPRSAAWAGLAIFVHRRVKNVLWPIEPGEWLVAIAAVWLAAETLAASGFLSQNFRSPVTLVTALTCLLLVVPTLTQRLATDWKFFFSFLVLVFAWPLLTGLLNSSPTRHLEWLSRSGDVVHQFRFFLAAVALGVMVVRDRLRGVRHGWLHWASLAVVVLIPLTTALRQSFD